MLNSLPSKLKTPVTRAICIPKPQAQSRALSYTSTHSTMEKGKEKEQSPSISSSTKSPFPSSNDPKPPTSNPDASPYTATDAATFSRLGASITAMPADEVQSLNPSPSLRLFGAPVRSVGKEREKVVYTNADAAEFVRRGACMVVWPEEEGNGGAEREERRD